MYQNEVESILKFIMSWNFIKWYVLIVIALLFIGGVILRIIYFNRNEEIKIFSKESIFAIFFVIVIPPICLRLMNALDLINVGGESVGSGNNLFFMGLIAFFIVCFVLNK